MVQAGSRKTKLAHHQGRRNERQPHCLPIPPAGQFDLGGRQNGKQVEAASGPQQDGMGWVEGGAALKYSPQVLPVFPISRHGCQAQHGQEGYKLEP